MKPYLDTSVVRALMGGNPTHKRVVLDELGSAKPTISKFTEMETRRGVIVELLEFCDLLKNPNITTLGEAFDQWGQSFKTRSIKTINTFVNQFADSIPIARDNTEELYYRLSLYVEDLERKIGEFEVINTNQTKCARASIKFAIADTNRVEDSVKSFLAEFGNVTKCKSLCNIEKFVANKHLKQVKSLIQDNQQNPSGPNSAHNKIVTQLALNLSGSKPHSCSNCGKIGDAVIVLECPKNSELFHTDLVFDRMCDLLEKHHRLLPSQTAIVNEGKPNPPSSPPRNTSVSRATVSKKTRTKRSR